MKFPSNPHKKKRRLIQYGYMTRNEWRGFIIAGGVKDKKTQDKLLHYLFRKR